MDQMPNPAMNQTPEPEGHSNGLWYVVGAVVIIALGLWYFYGTKAPAVENQTAGTQASTIEQTQIPPLAGGNTTADISANLNQVPDTSAALNADATAAANAISGL